MKPKKLKPKRRQLPRTHAERVNDAILTIPVVAGRGKKRRGG